MTRDRPSLDLAASCGHVGCGGSEACLRSEPPQCMYSERGCCGGPVTQTGDGFDYCMNHGPLRVQQVRDQIGLTDEEPK